MFKSLISIRDVWIDIANECELLAGRATIARRELIARPYDPPRDLPLAVH